MLTANRVRHADVEREIAGLFAAPQAHAGEGPGYVGLELEWIPARTGTHPPATVSVPELKRLLATDPDLVEQGRITFEPGGQLEISALPSPTVASLLNSTATLLARVRRALARDDVELFAAGANPWHSLEQLGLQTPAPRYIAQQANYDAIGPAGRHMMRQTAALQVCLDLGPPEVARDRWRLANLAGPALAAAFANSPLLEGKSTGTPGTRGNLWQAVDPSRTGYDGRQLGARATSESAAGAYADFAQHAEFMALPRGEEAPPLRHPFAAWLAGDVGDESRPDADDLAHHISTLFPPVRPRHHLEVRYIDALPERWMPVPVIVLAALLYDSTATREALELMDGRPLDNAAWSASAELAMRDPSLRFGADILFGLALEAIPRLPAGYMPPGSISLVSAYRERFIAGRRCPGDEQLDRYQQDPEDLSTWK